MTKSERVESIIHEIFAKKGMDIDPKGDDKHMKKFVRLNKLRYRHFLAI